VVRWRCVDLRRVIKERFEVDLDEVSIGRVLKELGFAHVSPRLRHPKQDPQAIEVLKKLCNAVAAVTADKEIAPEVLIEISFQDEMRVGQKNGVVYQWAKKGTRPRQPKDQRYANAYVMCSARSARRATPAPRLCFRAPTPVPCSFTSTRSVAVSRAAPTP
jgi:hypothetical protein